MGVWSLPGISLEDMLKLTKGFVDILILASGYQSSGHLAHWDPHSITKAFQWGLFFEDVLSSLDDYQDSVDGLDGALSELKCNPNFPQGLMHITSATLSRGRTFILEYMIHNVPLGDTHLKSCLKATIEMGLDELRRTENNYLHIYLDKLMLQNATGNSVSQGMGYLKDLPFPCPDNVQHNIAAKLTGSGLTIFSIQEILKRQIRVSCISSAETCLDILAKTTNQCNSLLQERNDTAAAMIEEHLFNSITLANWRKRCLSYLLDKRTIRLVSGASMIFSAPRSRWVQVFDRLDMSGKTEINFHETVELLLLGCISSRWSHLIEHFMSVCQESPSISTMYHEVQNILLGRYQNSEHKEEINNSKEQDILEYLNVKFSIQPHHLWELSPTLAAMSLPSWSELLRLYARELASLFKGKTTPIRCCTCIENMKEHRDCKRVPGQLLSEHS